MQMRSYERTFHYSVFQVISGRSQKSWRNGMEKRVFFLWKSVSQSVELFVKVNKSIMRVSTPFARDKGRLGTLVAKCCFTAPSSPPRKSNLMMMMAMHDEYKNMEKFMLKKSHVLILLIWQNIANVLLASWLVFIRSCNIIRSLVSFTELLLFSCSARSYPFCIINESCWTRVQSESKERRKQ